MNTDLRDRLYAQIEAELNLCEPLITPVCCYNYGKPELRASLIETIAETCIKGKLSISQAIAQVEQLYSINTIN